MMYDILSSLPLEILVQVAQYLDPEDIVRAQRVRTHIVLLNLMFEQVPRRVLTWPRSPNGGAFYSRAIQSSRLFCGKPSGFWAWIRKALLRMQQLLMR